ncbi:unnamed protein product, partial [marine sediment metagenome]
MKSEIDRRDRETEDERERETDPRSGKGGRISGAWGGT